MALAHEIDDSVLTGSLSAESKGQPDEMIRDYEPVPGVEWRFGLPNYARVNKAYFEGRTKVHAQGSLEAVVQKLVKNWEVESHHIEDPAQWKTMDVSKFKASLNGGCPIDANKMAEVGPYNMLLGKIQGYDSTQQTFESANAIFSEVFTEGFAFEVLEVFSEPPNVSFRWRHFGRFAGQYVDDRGRVYKGDGRMIEVIGMCAARVSEALQIEELQVFYDPNSQIQPLMNCPGGRDRGSLCPFSAGMCRETGSDEEEDEDEIEQDTHVDEASEAGRGGGRGRMRNVHVDEASVQQKKVLQ